jgi:murein L,D-transpeptidase YcbB/YkuD
MIRYSALFLLALTAVCSSCKKSRSDIGAILFKETKNRTYKKVDSAAYYRVFREVLGAKKDSLIYGETLSAFYKRNESEPYFIVSFVSGEQLKKALVYFGNAPEHGLNPEKFHYTRLKTLINRLYERKGIRKLDDAYRDIAETELFTADALLSYAKALRYGVVNPRKIFARYYMETAKPDSAFINRVLTVSKLQQFLDSIQPAGREYRGLQAALRGHKAYPGMSAGETEKVLSLNLERLRWQNKPSADRYIWVNIADYSLKYVDKGKKVLAMKVCVGKGPEQEPEIADYDESDGSVRPFNHTTPQLNSEINDIQVNPVWNIPESIAKNEIISLAAKDRYYLSNSNINVYTRSGEQVDPDQINWSEVSGTDVPYTFKQAPGKGNALGKIKFLFPNASSVYLHDTPAQKAFQQEVRAVSHGCVRVEKPLKLAQAILGQGAKLNLVKKEMGEKIPTARDIAVSPKVAVYLDYQTAFLNDEEKIAIRPDVYKLDAILYKRMGKWLYYR